VRISDGVRAGLVAAWLVTAALLAGCSTTVDGAATCAGCGNGSEPDFPTSRPTTSAPTPTAPSTKTQPPAGAEILAPNANGYVYIETRSGKTRCQISTGTVGCESEFTDSPVIDGERATGVEVSAGGSNRWVVGNLGAMPTTTIDYATYSAAGWIIEAASGGTRFTNTDTGHGMFVSTEGVEFF
jgi:hypothetical protein